MMGQSFFPYKMMERSVFLPKKNDGAKIFIAFENDGAGTLFDQEKYLLPGVCSGKFCPLPKQTFS